MGVRDRDWWKDAYRNATYEPKKFRRPEENPTGDPVYPKQGPREPLPFALKVATVVLAFIAAVVACLHKSRLI